MRPIIGLCGLIGSGKTTVAHCLIARHSFMRLRFAGALKEMAQCVGLTPAQIDNGEKETPCELIGGKTPRQFMQLLGTEFGRNMIDPNLWTKVWRRRLETFPKYAGVVVDDVRFPNEAAAIRDASPFSLLIRIVREPAIQQQHASELQTFPVDFTLLNDGTKDDLYAKADELVVPRLTAFEEAIACGTQSR